YQLTMPASRKNLSFVSSAQAVQATIRQLGIFVTHRLFVKDDIKLGLLQELGSAVTNPYQDYYFVCAKEQLKQESILVLRSWIKKEFAM
ncbi:LysR family transcriptional regulator, partial [Vibrio sp. RM-69-4]|nr:LysR family transcriptional regulator [Vibrio sp. RM-69-4]